MRDRRQENGIKRTRRRNFIIAAVEILGIASVFAVGFSAWVFSGGSDQINTGNIGILSATAQVNYAYVSCIDNLAIRTFNYSPGYGFVQSDGSYGNTCTITGKADFNVINAKTAISSLESNDRFTLTIAFTTNAGSSFTAANPRLLEGGFSNVASESSTDVAGATSANAFNIVLSSAESSSSSITNFEFAVTLTYSGSLGSFPNLSTNTFSFALTPGEYLA